jgi:hypothetical protein
MLLKDEFVAYRIEVKPEAIAMNDYAQMKQERVEIMQGLSTFLTAIMPIAQGAPPMVPYLMEIMRWMFAGFRGGSGMEAVLEQAIQAANMMVQQAMNAPPKPDPKVEGEKVKLQVVQAKAQGDLQVNQAKVQANMMNAQTKMKTAEHQAQMSERQMMLDMQRQAMGLDQPQGGDDGSDGDRAG